MRIALIADVYPPMRSSAAVQLRDLSREFARQGHFVTVLIPSADIDKPWRLEDVDGVQVMRLKALPTKDVGYARRTISELLLPLLMQYNLRKSPLANTCWDGVVWYSPTIFLGPIANTLKKASACKSYLIIRDIFPEWAVDMGLISRGWAYRFFKFVEHYQYSVADVIGVQTLGNSSYFDDWAAKTGRRVEVLRNWFADVPEVGSTISIANTALARKIIFVYAGNMGIAQGMRILLDLAERLRGRKDVGFLFVGRGSESARLRAEAEALGLENVLFHDEIDPSEIPGLYTQCHVGLIALDPRHKTHNIPGKFLSYMQSGLPVLASINPGNDLESLIRDEGVGRVCTDNSVETLEQLANALADEISSGESAYKSCRKLSVKMFSPETAANQIIHALNA